MSEIDKFSPAQYRYYYNKVMDIQASITKEDMGKKEGNEGLKKYNYDFEQSAKKAKEFINKEIDISLKLFGTTPNKLSEEQKEELRKELRKHQKKNDIRFIFPPSGCPVKEYKENACYTYRHWGGKDCITFSRVANSKDPSNCHF